MTRLHECRPLTATFFALALFANPICTQTSAASPAAPRDPSEKTTDNDDTVQLSAFEVTADKDNGYIASESATGTRVASKIRDLPFLVDVVTSDFMRDFAAFDMSQQLGWVPN